MKFGGDVIDKQCTAMHFSHLFAKISHICDAAVTNKNISFTPTSSSNANGLSLQSVMLSEVLGKFKLDSNKSARSGELDPVFKNCCSYYCIRYLFNL